MKAHVRGIEFFEIEDLYTSGDLHFKNKVSGTSERLVERQKGQWDVEQKGSWNVRKVSGMLERLVKHQKGQRNVRKVNGISERSVEL